jgi:hypothetical protein
MIYFKSSNNKKSNSNEIKVEMRSNDSSNNKQIEKIQTAKQDSFGRGISLETKANNNTNNEFQNHVIIIESSGQTNLND